MTVFTVLIGLLGFASVILLVMSLFIFVFLGGVLQQDAAAKHEAKEWGVMVLGLAAGAFVLMLIIIAVRHAFFG